VYVVDQLAGQVIKLSPHGQILARWGGNGSAKGRFLNPHGIATDHTGNVYVADYGRLRVVKLSPSGHLLAVIGAGQFDEDEAPEGVAVDAQGNLYVGAGGVMKYSPRGRLLAKWTTYGPQHASLAGAFGVAVDRGGDVFVIDQPGRALVKLSPKGKTLAVRR
jgi:sugar lactone lactonase YvrE